MAAQTDTTTVSEVTTKSSKGYARKDKKDESFFEKIGTIGRRKNIKEVEELAKEGHTAIAPSAPVGQSLDLAPSQYILGENEERSMVDPKSKNDPKVKELVQLLVGWLNDELAGYRIIVKDLEEDLFDGQILGKLIEKLAGLNLQLPEVTQSEQTQKAKLSTVLQAINNSLNLSQWAQEKWSVDGIHSKYLVPMLHLLVALAQHYNAPLRLPENVVVDIIVVQKREGLLHSRKVSEAITGSYELYGGKFERDALDTLVDRAPEKLNVVKKNLITFVNKHLNKLNLDVVDLDKQFHDGVYLVLLMGLLEGYFVPLYHYHLTPTTFEQKVHNVNVAFSLMQEAGLPKLKARPEDIVNEDLKCTLRVLYSLFTKYKSQQA